jgi:hypothetical protein
MSTNGTVTRRALVALNMPKRVPDLIVYANQIATAMTGNAFFPSPTIPLATFEANITALATAEQSVLTRVKGAAATRNVKLATVRSDMEQHKAYVQVVADANPSSSEAVIHSAGMAVKKLTARNKPDLAVTPGPVPGTAHLVAKSAGHRSAYEWQFSLDQKTWTAMPVTLQAKTDVSGLTSATTYAFRVRPVLKTGEATWSQVVVQLIQ